MDAAVVVRVCGWLAVLALGFMLFWGVVAGCGLSRDQAAPRLPTRAPVAPKM